ncbi:MAG TPA: dephospho-CoA kinase [Solirubrobacterales bacterium]|nr:dephospho-CoA kinase [Solirubrobacterales bacterium]
MTRFVGLTGGIGAGKSEVLAAFEQLGVATLSTDRVAHDLFEDDEVRAALVDRWGEGIAPGGAVDRDRISEIVFNDRDELAWLESVTHPRVGAHVLEWRQSLDPEVPVAVVEVPLLFEAAMENAFDATVAVVADDELRDARLRERGQGGLAGREERQLDQAEKERRADHVIRNDASLEELQSKVRELIEELTAKGAE